MHTQTTLRYKILRHHRNLYAPAFQAGIGFYPALQATPMTRVELHADTKPRLQAANHMHAVNPQDATDSYKAELYNQIINLLDELDNEEQLPQQCSKPVDFTTAKINYIPKDEEGMYSDNYNFNICEEHVPRFIERRVNLERRIVVAKMTIIAGKCYVMRKGCLVLDTRKYIRRACDRSGDWRRGFWRDQQRTRLEKSIQIALQTKRDNLLFSPKRVALARRKAVEQKALAIQRGYIERSRLAKAIGQQYGLDVNASPQSLLNMWQLQRHSNDTNYVVSGRRSSNISNNNGNSNLVNNTDIARNLTLRSRCMRFY